MAVRNPHYESVGTFLGLNTQSTPTNLPPNSWIEGSNVIVTSGGAAAALRSPKKWGNLGLTGVNDAVSSFSFQRGSGLNMVLIEEGGNLYFLNESTAFQDDSWPFANSYHNRSSWLQVIDRAFAINPFGQFQVMLARGQPGNVIDQAITFIGIGATSVGPNVVATAGGSLNLQVGVTVSYAFHDSVRQHVGQCSPPSAPSGPANALQITTGFSAEPFVDGVVLFISVDGGAVRFLVVDSIGNPVIFPQGVTITLTSYHLDLNTTETLFNVPPPLNTVSVAGQVPNNPRFGFKHQDRVFLLGFPAMSAAQYTAPVSASQIIYSGLEAITIGQPAECFPPLNVITIPVRGEAAVGGCSTPVGALILSDRNAYMISGELVDIIISATNPLQTTYRLDSLQWGLGTRSPLTISVTPFGVMWLDQNKRIQLWPYSGLPTEVGIALRQELKQISDDPDIRWTAEATWFQSGDLQFYALTAATGSDWRNNTLFLVGMYESAQHQTNAYNTLAHPTTMIAALSDIAAESTITHLDNEGRNHCLVLQNFAPDGSSDVEMKDILDLDLAGDGWSANQQIFFGVTTGSFDGNPNWNHLHSVTFDAQFNDCAVQSRNFDDSRIEAANPTLAANEGITFQAIINRYGMHHKLRFQYPTDDVKRREIQNLRITYAAKTRP